eukprot:8701286-Pyramimonas_sp.AAC.1
MLLSAIRSTVDSPLPILCSLLERIALLLYSAVLDCGLYYCVGFGSSSESNYDRVQSRAKSRA